MCEVITSLSGPFAQCDQGLLQSKHSDCLYDLCRVAKASLDSHRCSILDNLANECLKSVPDLKWRNSTLCRKLNWIVFSVFDDTLPDKTFSSLFGACIRSIKTGVLLQPWIVTQERTRHIAHACMLNVVLIHLRDPKANVSDQMDVNACKDS